MMAAGAASDNLPVLCHPVLAEALLVVGPVAKAGPLIALFTARPQSRDQGTLAWGAFALAFLLGLILNLQPAPAVCSSPPKPKR